MPAEIKDKNTDVKDVNEITMDDLTGIIQEAVKNSTKEEIKALKDEMEGVERKQIFTDDADADSEFLQSKNDAVVDTTQFHKGYLLGHDVKSSGTMLGKQIVSNGGVFQRLSPELETFAKMIKCRFDNRRYADEGVDIKSYTEKIKADMKASGMSEGTDADGGYTVPTEFYNVVVQFAVAQSPLLSKVWRIPMSNQTLKIPKLSQAAGSYFGGITLTWTDEGAQKTSSKPTFEQLSFAARKLVGLLYMTDELIADSAINIVNFMVGVFTRAFQYEMEKMIIQGTGSGQPLGVLNDPSVNLVARNTASTVKYDDVIDMDAAIDENFSDLTWVTRKATVAALRKLKDDNNQPIFHADYSTMMGQRTVPDTMLGYQLVKTRNAPALGSKGDLILGDFGMFIMAMRQELKIDSSMHLKFDYDETAYRFVSRLDGKPGVSIAFAVLKAVMS